MQSQYNRVHMRQSQLFTKIRKETPKGEVSKNADLLVRAGFVYKEIAGVYSYLPLGLRVLNNVADIIREEMNAIGGQEVHLTVLQEEALWKKSGRWDDTVVDDWFKTELKNGNKLGLAFTHEEPLARLLKDHVSSYKDLPFFVYQIQTKFRNELRAKSGLMRGREFLMKDMYSFTTGSEETDKLHDKAKNAYMNIFRRVGLGDRTFLTASYGGSFSKYSYEFQTLSDAGEDTIHYSEKENIAVNKDDYTPELLKDFGLENITFKEGKSIEVGDIYKLGTKFSEPIGLTYKNETGENIPVDMGSYGIGVSRLMGTIVEVLSDEKGMVWPEAVAPYRIHLVELSNGNAKVKEHADEIYQGLRDHGIEVLYDDRDVRSGEKLGGADLMGLPLRAVISERTMEEGKIEVTERKNGTTRMISEAEFYTV